MSRSSLAAKLHELARLELSDEQAEELWRNVARHRRALWNRLGRDVGSRVALLDYLVNIRPGFGEPQIIERARLESIEQRAITDALTGLQNRSVFDVELEREVSRANRYGLPLSLLLLDLDHFKDTNDRHGHHVGDGVLRAVGDLLLRHVRSADVACRYGGDEFAIILPDTDLAVAANVGARMTAAVSSWFEMNPIDGKYVDVAASAGVASLPPGGSSAELIQAADHALYEAKRSGGNCFPIVPISGAFL